MVDVGSKDSTMREATAIGHVKMHADTLKLVIEGNAKKGDVIGTASVNAGANNDVRIPVGGIGLNGDVVAKLVIDGQVADIERIEVR